MCTPTTLKTIWTERENHNKDYLANKWENKETHPYTKKSRDNKMSDYQKWWKKNENKTHHDLFHIFHKNESINDEHRAFTIQWTKENRSIPQQDRREKVQFKINITPSDLSKWEKFKLL